MMRNKTSSSLQKTYDECYLICSTAVYYEGQGNETEALRCWRSALDQIYYHNAYRMPSNYRPRSETEKAMQDSLRDMELQCKERVDLLEALKQSRQEKNGTESSDGFQRPDAVLEKVSSKSKQPESAESSQRGYIGEGTIPAVSIPDLSRPPPLPQRPSVGASRSSSELAVVGKRTPRSSIDLPPSSRPSAQSPPLLAPPPKPSRSTSPDKSHTMRTTLRSSDKRDRRPSSKSSHTKQKEPEGANKAATLAWSAKKPAKDSGRKDSGKATEADLVYNAAALDAVRRLAVVDSQPKRPESSRELRYESSTRRLVDEASLSPGRPTLGSGGETSLSNKRSASYSSLPRDSRIESSGSPSNSQPLIQIGPTDSDLTGSASDRESRRKADSKKLEPLPYPSYLKEYPDAAARRMKIEGLAMPSRSRKASPRRDAIPDGPSARLAHSSVANISSPRIRERQYAKGDSARPRKPKKAVNPEISSDSGNDSSSSMGPSSRPTAKSSKSKQKKKEPVLVDGTPPESDEDDVVGENEWKKKVARVLKNLPRGVDEASAKQIINEIVVQGDEVHWDDVAGLEIAKTALKETVVYPFLRPDLFMGLREPARGMLLFGPPGTGKTMLARAVATESRSTFFSISASSLTSKYLGESEKLVRALFALAKALAPSIIFVDEIDSLLSARSGSGEHEATRRIKTEFLIQWSDLQRAAAGREQSEREKEKGDASRVLVLAATNLPWAIDEAARRRFVRRQYIPLPEDITRAKQLTNLLGHQKHSLSPDDFDELVRLTDGFSGSDITALAKDAAMGPLRSLGEALLMMSMDDIRPIQLSDFKASMITIRPSVSKQGLKEFEDWAKEFGERGG